MVSLEYNKKMDTGEKLFFNGDSTFSMQPQLQDLKKIASKWSLAGDAQLLGFMQNLSNKIISQAHEIQKQLNNLTYKTKTMNVRLNNVCNDFNASANTQFVENRVYDEDPCIIQQDVNDKQKPEMSEQERDAQMMGMMNKAVTLCKKVITMSSKDERKDRYETRHLPSLLNCKVVRDYKRSVVPANQISPSLNNSTDDFDAISQMSDASEVKQVPGSLESSLKADSLIGGKSAVEDLFTNKEDDTGTGLFPVPVKVMDRDKFANSLNAMFKNVKTDFASSPTSSSSSLTSNKLKENKGKVKSLFDESESDDEDIFTQIANIVDKRADQSNSTNKNSVPEDSQKKIPIGGISVFGTIFGNPEPPSSNHYEEDDLKPSSFNESRPTKTLLSLFDDDDDDDLFLSTIKKAPIVTSVSKTTPQQQHLIGQKEDEVMRPQKTIPVNSLFDDDVDDDIFSQLIKQSSKTAEVKENEVKPCMETVSKESMANDTNTAKEVNEKKSEAIKKVKSIFDDDDDVPFISDKAKKVGNKPLNTRMKSIFDDYDDDEEEKLSAVGRVEVVPIDKPPINVSDVNSKTLHSSPAKNLFGDDDDDGRDDDGRDDDDDLFQNLSKGTSKLELPKSPTETSEAQPSTITTTPTTLNPTKQFPNTLPNFSPVSPHKIKGNMISKLQTSLNIDPLKLGPYSYKNKRDDDVKVHPKVVHVGVVGLPSNEMLENYDDIPKIGDKFKMDGLDLGRTSILPSLVKGRPKMINRRRPTAQSFKNGDDNDSNVSQLNIKVHSKAPIITNSDIYSVGLTPDVGDVLESLQGKFLFDTNHLSNVVFDELEVKVQPPVGNQRDSSLLTSDLTTEEIKNFFDTEDFLSGEHLLSSSMKSHKFKPSYLFGDDEYGSDGHYGEKEGDKDDIYDVGDEDLFSGFNIKNEKIVDTKNILISKNETNVNNDHNIEVKKNKPMFTSDDQGDDDDDDLFANLKSTNPIQHKSAVATVTVVQSKSMFGDKNDDDDDDLFADVNFIKKDTIRSDWSSSGLLNGPNKLDQNASNRSTNISNKSVQVFHDDDDLFSGKFVPNLKGCTKAVTNLFDDSDDDIFNSPSSTRQPSKAGVKPSTFKSAKDNSENLLRDPSSNL